MWTAIFAAIAVFALCNVSRSSKNNRLKRGVPSDSAISPSVAAPTESLCHREDQRRVKCAKSLSYEEILPKPNPEEVIHVLLTMVSPSLPSLDFFVANNFKISSEDHCDGDICKVQVSLNNNVPLCQEGGIFLFKRLVSKIAV